MNNIKSKWIEALGTPAYEIPHEPIELVKKYEYEDFDLEVYIQRNDPKSFQRVMIAFPKNLTSALPAIAIPFYHPEAMLGFDPVTDEPLENFSDITMMKDLVKKGYITATADAYYITYTRNIYGKGDFERWGEAGKYLRLDNPEWSGMGKLVSDTTLLIDALDSDPRVDSSRMGIIGHSLGGKMAFYAGCLDERIKVIAASDFGIRWDQSNWEDIWYWYDKLEELKEKNMDHSQLLSISSKPFCLIAGQYDDDRSFDMMKKAQGYEPNDEKLMFINHATGHRPPQWALKESYDFLEKWL